MLCEVVHTSLLQEENHVEQKWVIPFPGTPETPDTTRLVKKLEPNESSKMKPAELSSNPNQNGSSTDLQENKMFIIWSHFGFRSGSSIEIDSWQ